MSYGNIIIRVIVLLVRNREIVLSPYHGSPKASKNCSEKKKVAVENKVEGIELGIWLGKFS